MKARVMKINLERKSSFVSEYSDSAFLDWGLNACFSYFFF